MKYTERRLPHGMYQSFEGRLAVHIHTLPVPQFPQMNSDFK
jgi:hypothetical protein